VRDEFSESATVVPVQLAASVVDFR